MKAQASNASVPILDLETSGATLDLYLEIDLQEQDKFIRLPVHVKNLADEGVILEVLDLPPGLDGSLLNQKAIIHLEPHGVTKETRVQSQVVWVRQGERGSGHYLLGLDLTEADFRTRRFLENLVARPKDMAELWTSWDQVHSIQADQPHDSKIIFYLGAGIFVGGVGLKATLPGSYDVMAMTLILVGMYVIAGKCLWDWWRRRTLRKAESRP